MVDYKQRKTRSFKRKQIPEVTVVKHGTVRDLSGPDKEYLSLVQDEDDRKMVHDYYGNDPNVTQFDYFLMDTRNGEPDQELYGLSGTGLNDSAYRIRRIKR